VFHFIQPQARLRLTLFLSMIDFSCMCQVYLYFMPVIAVPVPQKKRVNLPLCVHIQLPAGLLFQAVQPGFQLGQNILHAV